MKNRTDKVLLKVEIPIWFRVVYAIAAPPTPLFFLAFAVAFIINGLTLPGALISTFALVTVAAGLLLIPHVYSTIWVTELGLRWRRPFRLRTKKFKWEDIVTIVRPRFGISYDLAYIISKNGERIAVVRSMAGFTDLVELIRSRAPNLELKQRPTTLWPDQSVTRWKLLLLFIVLFTGYVIIRELFG